MLECATDGYAAPQEATIKCMEFLLRSGCQWNDDGKEVENAAGRPKLLRYCLERTQAHPWKQAMLMAMVRGSPECMQLLYEEGYEQHRSLAPRDHPALLAISFAVPVQSQSPIPESQNASGSR